MAKGTRVFISYSWDDEAHKTWVRSIATALREDGIDVTLDQWHLALGDQLPEFMEKAIRENDFILVVCTPKYRRRSNERVGGVGYEGDIITAEVLNKGNHRKFIPALRSGSWEESAPSWLLGKLYVDLRDGGSYEDGYRILLQTLRGEMPYIPPVAQPEHELRRREGEADVEEMNLPNLPYGMAFFVGRESEVIELEQRLVAGESVSISAVEGAGGIGKTALAVFVARRIASGFSSVAYIDLLGFSQQGASALTTEEALMGLIPQVSEVALPKQPNARALQDLWQSSCSKGRILLILDNAKDEKQVVPLIPSGASLSLIITSRNRIVLGGHSCTLELQPLSEADSANLVRRITHREITDAEATKIGSWCGNLPLAIEIAASTLNRDRLRTIETAKYISGLRSRTERRAELRDATSSILLSIEALPEELTDCWSMLGIFRNSFYKRDVAALWGTSEPGKELTELTQAYLLDYSYATKLYRMHDLVRDAAVELFLSKRLLAATVLWRASRIHKKLWNAHLNCLSSIRHWRKGNQIRSSLAFERARRTINRFGLHESLQEVATEGDTDKTIPSYSGFTPNDQISFLIGAMAFSMTPEDLADSNVELAGEFERAHEVRHINSSIVHRDRHLKLRDLAWANLIGVGVDRALENLLGGKR